MVSRTLRHFDETGASPRILVVRLSSLGDVVLATSVPAVLKDRFPESRITFLTKEAFTEVLRNNPNIDRLIPLSAKESSPAGVFRLARKLRAERFDLVVDLQTNPRAVLLCALVSVRKCVRADRDTFVRHAMVRSRRLLRRGNRHAVQRYLAAVQKLFGPVPALKPRVFLTETEKELAAQFLRSVEGPEKRPVVAICPGARWKTKLWGAYRMSALARRLVEAGYGVVVVGGAADEGVLDEMKTLFEDTMAVKFKSRDLRSIAALMSRCGCVVSNDSGLMHMAYSVGTPVVAIFGSTTPEFGFYPPDSRSTVVSKSFDCKPCDVHGKEKCSKKVLRCMESVTVPEVFDAVDATLRRAGNGGVRGASESNLPETRPREIELPRFLLDGGEPGPAWNTWSVPGRGPVVVRVPNWVGDVVMACPSLAALRSCTRGLRLVVVAHERVASLIESAALADEIVIFRGRGGGGFARVARTLRAEGFTIGVVMPDSFSSAFLFWLGGVKRIVGFRGDMRDVFLGVRLARRRWSHLSEQYAQLLPGECKVDGGFALIPGRQDVSRVRKLLREAGVRERSRLAVVAPGASYGETKRWPEESYARLVKLFVEKSRFEVVLVGNVRETTLCARVAGKAGCSTADLSGRTTLRDLAAIASVASVFVGNDSGAAHVAAASGCPVVAVFGSSDPGWTAPRGENVSVVYRKVSCSPCFLRKCPYELQCLSQIAEDDVYRAAIDISKPTRSDQSGG